MLFMMDEATLLLDLLIWGLRLALLLLVLSFWSKTANILFSLLYPITAGAFVSVLSFGTLGAVSDSSDTFNSILLGGAMGLCFGIALAVQAARRGKQTVGTALIKLFVVPVAMVVLGVALLFAAGVVMAFSQDPVVATVCLVILAALLGGGGGKIILIIFER